jgi:hypothetical protein
MFAAALHPLRRHGPDAAIEIDLIPARAKHFSGTRCGEDRKFESARRDSFASRQVAHKGGDIRIGPSPRDGRASDAGVSAGAD